MAVHAVSLKWLSQAHAPTTQPGRPASVAQRDSDGDLAKDSRDCTAAATDIPPAKKPDKTTKHHEVQSELGEDVLGLCQTEVDELLNHLGAAGGRALLALIYRLSSIESQLAALRALIVRGAAQNTTAETTTQTPRGSTDSSDSDFKLSGPSGILDQVFNSNLALWNSMN